MLSSPDLSFCRTLPLAVFNQLQKLLQQMAQLVGKQVVVLTEAILTPLPVSEQQPLQKFTVLVSKQFSVLLVGNAQATGGEEEDTGNNSSSSHDSLLNVRLTFDPNVIASFLTQLKNLFPHDSLNYQRLVDYHQILAPNDAQLQTEFTLLLLNLLLSTDNNKEISQPAANNAYVSVCQPQEDALRKQIEQERLLNQVTTQIRQSLDLQIILGTAVERVRVFLELDRLIIYKFEESKLNSQNLTHLLESSQQYLPLNACGVVYESKANDTITPVLTCTENCFAPTSKCWEKYRQGFTLAVDDVETTYVLQECLLNFLRETQVRAKVVTPIVFQEKLWGLLIAHQCHVPRNWQESEKNFLTQIGEQLAIAIHQAELMRSLNQEKQTLEERLVDCTVALEDALVAAQAASRVRSEFLATINHELFTPLTHVIGLSSTLLRLPLGHLSQRQRNFLQTIHDSGEHLLELINDILDLSQLEAGKEVLKISVFSLQEIAEKTIASLLEKAHEKQVNLKLDLQINPLHKKFAADAKRVKKILWNLLNNAVKFTPEGGDVTLRLWLEDDNAVFQVEDTGIGIAQEQLPLLFEKFQQLDAPYSRRYQGTGLGLALTKQLVELHRGRIEVESTVGVGSIFTVWIPAQPISVSP